MEGAGQPNDVDDEYGAELDAMVQETETKIQQKEIDKPKEPAQKRSMFQSAIASAAHQPEDKPESQSNPTGQEAMPDFEEMDKMMQQLFGAGMGGMPSEGGGGQPPGMPDISNIANMLSQLGGPGGLDDEGEGQVDDGKVQEAQKLFKDCIDQIQKETQEFEKGDTSKEGEKNGEEAKDKPDLSDPKGEGLDALAGMFKHQENIAKDKNSGSTPLNTAQDGSRAQQQEDPFAKMFQQMGAPGGGNPGENPFDDPQMMNMFKGLLGNLEQEGQPPSGTGEIPKEQNAQMDNLFSQFTSFLKETEGGEGDEGFKGALDQVVKEIISKDSLYQPMKNLKDAFPAWLEDNWQKLSDEDLERYNNQLDKVTEICDFFQKEEEAGKSKDGEQPKKNEDGSEVKPEVFDLLSQLQELGHPPPELMKQIQEKQGNDPNASGGIPGFGAGSDPFKDLFSGAAGAEGGLPPEMQKLFANLAGPPDQSQSSTSQQNPQSNAKTEEAPKFNNPFEGL